MEQEILNFVQSVFAKFPMAVTVYLILSGLYTVFCAVATLTKTTRDDKIAERLKIFFSIPIGKK